MRALRLAVTSAVLLSVALAASPARASDPAAARDQLKLGWELSQQGKCAEAIPHLKESLRLDVKAITLINLANCEEKVKSYADALGHWVDARARALVEGNTAIEAEAERRAKALEPKLAHLTIRIAKAAPAGTKVSRDGIVLGKVSLGVPSTVSPGKHTIVVKAPGRKDARVTVSLAEAENKSIEVRAGEPAPTSPATATPVDQAPQERGGGGPSPLVYVGFGAGAAGLAVGAITGLMALSKANEVKSACPENLCASNANLDDLSTGRTLGTVSTIGFVVAGVGAAVGVWALAVGGGEDEAPKAALYLGPTGGSLRGSF